MGVELGDATRPWPEVVCLCGSTRFKQQFMEENYRLTCEGRIVLSVGFYAHADGKQREIGTADEPTELKVMLDELHKRKIDLADRVHVINVDGYIGSSTASEIAYAQEHHVPITYLES